MEISGALNGERAIIGNPCFNPGFPRRCENIQEVAASAVLGTDGASPATSMLHRVRLIFPADAGVGESMVFGINYIGPSGGVPLLAANFTYDETTPKGVYEPALAAGIQGTVLEPGGFFTVTRVYVAGGGPSMARTGVVIDYYQDEFT